ncbi:sulfotransferase domain-containing protein [Pseudoroseicyclus tamaricis]|uniref:Sulfotransferase domain-containing protein n=1 Tax=Pseudoroseicyclus tamaricis TaxID=2705421 RepID=A0A6B2JIN0_9RHOB|nr:sulfotransferase domain-containing protein [Pseudoroseicyclus tamaricis]NDV01243.1 sulfotransferase domain-containing protein [Pseudoroseicyclus tamaricis]
MLMSKGLNPIVLQGIQRSGTNFLSEVLMAGNYRVLNQVDPPRDDPRHKHFRWFADKDLIAMDYRYCNSVTATTIGEVNATAGWPEGTRHLVLFRDPEDWLHAIFRWGVDNEWFASEAEFIETGKHRAFMAEWHAFYGHWHRLAAADPDHVLILRYQDLKTEPAEVLARVDRFAGVARQTPIDPAVSIRKVRHSKPLDAPRQNLTSAQSLEAAAMEGAFDWRRCLSAR